MPGDAGKIIAAKTYVSIGANLRPLEKGLALAATRMRTWGAKVAKIGMAAFGGLAAAAFILRPAVKAAASYEAQLANVSTMLDEVGMRHMPMFEKQISQMSVTFAQSTETLTKGLYDILSASIAPAKAMDVLEVSAKAAVAGLTETGVAADAITTILNSYQMSASQAGKVSDILFATVKRGKTTFGQLAGAIGRVSATAALVGVRFEEVGAILATMTRAGIDTNEAVVSLNAILRAFLNPTTEAQKLAHELGFELHSATLRAEGFAGVMKRLSGISAEQVSILIPQIRGVKGLAAALQDAAGFAKDINLMFAAGGLTQEALAKQTDTTDFALKQLKEAVSKLAREIGVGLLPAVKTITEALTDMGKDSITLGDRLAAFMTKNLMVVEQTKTAIATTVQKTNKELTKLKANFGYTIAWMADKLGDASGIMSDDLEVFAHGIADMWRLQADSFAKQTKRMEISITDMVKASKWALRSLLTAMNQFMGIKPRGKREPPLPGTMVSGLRDWERLPKPGAELPDVMTGGMEDRFITPEGAEAGAAAAFSPQMMRVGAYMSQLRSVTGKLPTTISTRNLQEEIVKNTKDTADNTGELMDKFRGSRTYRSAGP